MKIEGDAYKEWIEFNITQDFLKRLAVMRLNRLESIIVNPNREEACGIVKGIDLVRSLIESAKEENRRED